MALPSRTPPPLAEWVRLHGRAVRGYLLGLVRRPHEADELTQEVFLRAWQAREQYEDQGKPRAYLMRIADRLACDRARRAGRETTLDTDAWHFCEPAAAVDDPDAAVLRTETNARLDEALKQLSPSQQRVLLLRFYGEMSFAEIAEATGSPLSTVLSHCHRGLKTLRRLLVEDVT